MVSGLVKACVLIAIHVIFCMAVERTVTSDAGRITGNTRTVVYGQSSSEITTFLGIPYAEPPVGNRRFARPVPKAAFVESYSAFNFGAACPQVSLIPNVPPPASNEDCLFLNIFTPDTSGTVEKVPVMVWIHGGGYIIGNGNIHGGENLAAYGKVVVVTLNYRLGPLGFLDTGNGNVDPNNGLFDQQLAIKWVHFNIESFGGDPSKVTIFGESAGAASVMYQALYNKNRGFFHKVIAQSGSPYVRWTMVSDPVQKSTQFALNLNCPVTDTTEMIKCLREIKDVNKMIQMSFITLKYGDFIIWGPTLDTDILTNEMFSVVTNGRINQSFFNSLDLMMGTNIYEGAFLIELPIWNAFRETINNQSTPIDIIKLANNIVFNSTLSSYYPQYVTELTNAVTYAYTNFDDPSDRALHSQQVNDYMTDLLFVSPATLALESHTRQNNGDSATYQYVFNEKTPFIQRPYWVKGAVHTDEIPYVFGFPAGLESEFNYNRTQADTQWPFTSNVMSYWTNFAKTGNPNKAGLVQWNEYTTIDKDYIYLRSSNIVNRKSYNARRIAFWTDYVPALIKSVESRPTPTPPLVEPCTSSSTHVIFSSWLLFAILAISK